MAGSAGSVTTGRGGFTVTVGESVLADGFVTVVDALGALGVLGVLGTLGTFTNVDEDDSAGAGRLAGTVEAGVMVVVVGGVTVGGAVADGVDKLEGGGVGDWGVD